MSIILGGLNRNSILDPPSSGSKVVPIRAPWNSLHQTLKAAGLPSRQLTLPNLPLDLVTPTTGSGATNPKPLLETQFSSIILPSNTTLITFAFANDSRRQINVDIPGSLGNFCQPSSEF